jgi:hypothetical protein
MSGDTDQSMDVLDPSGKVCGRYHFDGLPKSPKPFYKSYFNGLYTPKGCNIAAPQPPDHPHHKGLQYGLCAKDVNFWEEDKAREPKDRQLRIGTQFTKVVEWFDTGFSQDIIWQEDDCVTFLETRNVSVKPTTSGHVWTWQTTLTAQRDVDLIVSVWDINPGYYGLGLRLAPELFLNQSKVTRIPASGGGVQRVTVQGTKAVLTFEQDTTSQQDVLYIHGCEHGGGEEFAFVSIGPTNGGGLTVKKGSELKRSYRITVADVT